MEEKIVTSKIVVESNHELTDLVRYIHKSRAERIVLTFTEHTDILISPINLKVLNETAQRENKLLIAQIIQNPTGIRNAKLAGIKTIDTPSNPTPYEWEEASEMILKTKKEKLERKKFLEKVSTTPDTNEVFEEKIESKIEELPKEKVIPKKEDSSKVEDPTPKGYVDKRGVKKSNMFVSIDEDIPFPNEELVTTESIQPLVKKKPLLKKLFNFKPRLSKGSKPFNKKKFFKVFLLVFVPLLLLTVLGGFLFNQFGTFVKIKIFVESKKVEVETILTGDEKIDEIDFENLKIPIKSEEESKSLSSTITATGKKFDGENAEGQIDIYFDAPCLEDTQPINLPAGHIVTNTGGKTYKLKNSVSLSCPSALTVAGVPIEASTFGPEYNISTINDNFTIQGYPNSEIFGKNKVAITGGTKEEYTVLSQIDIDNGVEALSTTAIEEVKSELRDISGDWEIIEDSILSSVEKSSIKTDKKVGEEATDVNLDITIKGTATYFKTDGLTEKLKDLLRSKAVEENLFESEKDLELDLGDDIQKEVTVEEAKTGSVKIKIVASGDIKPKIDKEELVSELKGLEWDEGKNLLNSLNYAVKKPDATFDPMNYPAFLKRFPTREGGILIEIKDIEVSEDDE